MMNNQEQGESVEQSNQPRLCSRGCGFFSNPATGSMCSKCYRETVSAAEREKAATAAVAAASTTVPASQPMAVPAAPFVAPEVPAAVSVAAATAVPSPSTGVTQQQEAQLSSGAPEASGTSDEGLHAAAAPADPPVQKNPGRCFTCNKKVGLTGFKCRCGYVYCGGHRLAEAHNCMFNYKAAERERLARANPLVQAAKVDKL